ncbi:hypothetical protein ALC56_10562 [Trachymyrmex septentrionalis]|uniref:Mos1 transposase HTH domain-containing protein n=1 Tax=Trachymyrmex septentrionalis TaxID=34720 RepID=A0A195F4J1_9HYME|nr:hypothetical protein ALC56_10562 [Trachymyrmex septentrionalis]
MGRHKSRRDSRGKRHRSLFSSQSGEGRKNDRVEKLEHIVKNLDRRAHSLCIHRENWIQEHMEGLAEQYGWNDRAIMRSKCADAFRMLTVAYGEATLDRSNVYRWYKMFSEGREDVNDEERAGRPSTSTTDENIDEVKKIVLANRNGQ